MLPDVGFSKEIDTPPTPLPHPSYYISINFVKVKGFGFQVPSKMSLKITVTLSVPLKFPEDIMQQENFLIVDNKERNGQFSFFFNACFKPENRKGYPGIAVVRKH